MASSSLPFFFPAVEVDGAWYGDGGIRLTAPLSPGGSPRRQTDHRRLYALRPDARGSRAPGRPGYPPPAQVAGVLYNAIFLDQLDSDALTCDRSTGSSRGCLRSPRWPAAIELLMLRPSSGSGTAREHLRARAATGLPLPHARSGDSGDALERHAEPGDVSDPITSDTSSSWVRRMRKPNSRRFGTSSASGRRSRKRTIGEQLSRTAAPQIGDSAGARTHNVAELNRVWDRSYATHGYGEHQCHSTLGTLRSWPRCS